MIIKRSHMCNELRISDAGKKVKLNGWVQRQRNFGKLIFCDLRDKTGICQIVFDETAEKDLFEKAASLKSEYVIGVEGVVRERQEENKDIDTGKIEVLAENLIIYSEAETPPIYIKDDDDVAENLRLKYRYLDLRKHKMQQNLQFRHRITKITRDFFDSEGFTEIETPMLINPTPEGARDYLVPSRTNPGCFFALPQSPQIYKQILMAAGTDRYFQIAKCFRDEDLRADRQPEFTQIDLEMSFVDTDDILEVQERYLQTLFKELLDVDIELPLKKMTYDEAMTNYGSDKPDLRFGFLLQDIKELVDKVEFPVFNDAESVRAIVIDKASPLFSRKDIDKLKDSIATFGARNLLWIRVGDEITSSFNKFYNPDQLKELSDFLGAEKDDLILIVAGTKDTVFDSLGFLRRDIAQKLNLLDDSDYKLLWVVDFPLFEYDDELKRYKSKHHPFTSPNDDDIPLLDENLGKVRAKAYDIVLNGVELGGGSIRIHNRNLQEKMFSCLGLSSEEAKEKFGYLLDAFSYGAPPHGGIAYGLDRMAMLLTAQKSIREVIAFPKNQQAQCMMSNAPTEPAAEQLEELGIKVEIPEK